MPPMVDSIVHQADELRGKLRTPTAPLLAEIAVYVTPINQESALIPGQTWELYTGVYLFNDFVCVLSQFTGAIQAFPSAPFFA